MQISMMLNATRTGFEALPVRRSGPRKRTGVALLAATVLATAGCSGSLMHPKTVAVMRKGGQMEPARADATPAEPRRPAPYVAPQPAPPAAQAYREPETVPPPAAPYRAPEPAASAPPARADAEARAAEAPVAPPRPSETQVEARPAAPTPRYSAPPQLAQSTPAPTPAPRPAARPQPAPVETQLPPRAPVSPASPRAAEALAATPPAPYAPLGPATDHATIIFTTTPGQPCLNCETVKFTMTPSGDTLVERGSWDISHVKWRYKAAHAHAKPDRVLAFAQNLASDRPSGSRMMRAGGVACQGPSATAGSVKIEWLEAGRHDILTVQFDCSMQGDSALAQRLRQAPNLLGIRAIAVR